MNEAKLREALNQVKELNDLWFDTFTLPDGATGIHDEIENVISAALSAPPRNCDVGTADEQFKRFGPFCNRYDDDCTGCPCDTDSAWNFTNCFARWAQMQYEEIRREMKDIDLQNIHAVCVDCASTLCFTQKDKAVGVWMDECEICHQRKPCTDLWHDWNPPKRGGVK